MVTQNARGTGKILVTGATGNVGSGVITNLTALGVAVRALVRDESKAQGLKDSGVEVVVGDLEKPETLDSAFQGVDRVFLLTPNHPNQATLGKNGIAAAKRAGNAYIVRSSAMVPAPALQTSLGRHHAEVDAELKASGLLYAIIRPTFFMQNTTMAGQTVASDGVLYMPFKDGKVGMIDVRDIVEVAASILTSDGHEGRTYTLMGPESISFYDVAAGLSKALGKELQYTDVPVEAGRQSMIDMGLPEWLAEEFRELFVNFAQGGADFTTSDVEFVTGKRARSYEQFARDYAEAFGGAS